MDDLGHVETWQNSSEEVFRTKFPLHRACRDGDLEALSLLLVEAAQHNLHLEDSFYGWTPLHWAAYFGKLGCLRKLVLECEGVADVNIKSSKFLETPAHFAAFGDHPHCLQWLLQVGADINAQDYLGETPSHKAARTGSLECLSLLASHGARLLVHSNNGQAAAEVAASCGHLKCAQYIEEAAVRQQSLPQASITATKGFTPTNGFCSPLFTSEHRSSPTHNGYHPQPSDDQAMVAEESYTNCQTTQPTACSGSMDITLSKAVSRNLVAIAGRKRSRDDEEEYGYKRHKANGNNPFEDHQMELEMTAHRIEDFQGNDADFHHLPSKEYEEGKWDKVNQNSEQDRNLTCYNTSVQEHETEVYCCQGYDSMCYDALAGLYNGS